MAKFQLLNSICVICRPLSNAYFGLFLGPKEHISPQSRHDRNDLSNSNQNLFHKIMDPNGIYISWRPQLTLREPQEPGQPIQKSTLKFSLEKRDGKSMLFEVIFQFGTKKEIEIFFGFRPILF